MVNPQVETFPVEPDTAKRLLERIPASADGFVLVLPARIGPQGGMYRDAHLTSVKELRAAGVTADFLHPADQRTGLGEYSAEVVFAFAVGVAQNMTWDAAKAVWGYLRAHAAAYATNEEPPMVRLEVARLRRDGLEIEGLSVTAPASDSNAEVFLRLLMGDQTDESGRA